MSKGRDSGYRLPPFVPMLKSTMATPAWQKMSHGAQALYIALKNRLSSDCSNNGRLFLSQRDAKRELGSNFDEITRWSREHRHYGFVVQTRGGGLGVDGKGTSPFLRLTECPCNGEPPTNDFLRWNGQPFRPPKKQNPAPEMESTLLRKWRAVPLRKWRAGPKKSQQNPAPEMESISRKRSKQSSLLLASLPRRRGEP